MIARPGQTGSLARMRRYILIDLLLTPGSLEDARLAQRRMAALTAQIEQRLQTNPIHPNPTNPNGENHEQQPNHA